MLAENTPPVEERTIALMMPFGGGDAVKGKTSILDYMRIKYLVEEKIDVKARGTAAKIKYTLKVYNLGIGYIPKEVLRGIADADVLLGLLTAPNLNVIFELAVRNMLRDEMLLIVKGDRNDVVPQYLQDMAYVSYAANDANLVLDKMNEIANSPAVGLNWDSDMPEDLRALFNIHGADATLRKSLEVSLQRLETNPPKRPEWIMDLVKDLDPGCVLQAWNCYYPYNVLRIRWKRKNDDRRYEADDMNGPPVVYDCNEEYIKMLGLQAKLPDPNGPQAITPQAIMDWLESKRIINDNDLAAFKDDQVRLTQNAIFEDGYATAAVPLRFNGNHPHEQYKNKAYLPVLAGKRVVGPDLERKHLMFLLVVFVEYASGSMSIQREASRG